MGCLGAPRLQIPRIWNNQFRQLRRRIKSGILNAASGKHAMRLILNAPIFFYPWRLTCPRSSLVHSESPFGRPWSVWWPRARSIGAPTSVEIVCASSSLRRSYCPDRLPTRRARSAGGVAAQPGCASLAAVIAASVSALPLRQIVAQTGSRPSRWCNFSDGLRA